MNNGFIILYPTGGITELDWEIIDLKDIYYIGVIDNFTKLEGGNENTEYAVLFKGNKTTVYWYASSRAEANKRCKELIDLVTIDKLQGKPTVVRIPALELHPRSKRDELIKKAEC